MKKILAIVAGVVVGFVIVFIGDATTHALSPIPANLNVADKTSIANYISTIPLYVMIIMAIFWLLSVFIGSMLAARINRSEWKNTALITGGILMAASILNLMLIPHPLWMWLVVIIGYIPIAFIGGRMVRKKEMNS